MTPRRPTGCCASRAWRRRASSRAAAPASCVVPAADALAFTFDDGVTRVLTATEALTMQPTLAQLQRRLDPQRFFQVSRAAIVSLEAVREAKPMSDGTGQVVLSNGTVLAVSRRRWRELLEQLGG